jgi:hypothetical protein
MAAVPGTLTAITSSPATAIPAVMGCLAPASVPAPPRLLAGDAMLCIPAIAALTAAFIIAGGIMSTHASVVAFQLPTAALTVPAADHTCCVNLAAVVACAVLARDVLPECAPLQAA